MPLGTKPTNPDRPKLIFEPKNVREMVTAIMAEMASRKIGFERGS